MRCCWQGFSLIACSTAAYAEHFGLQIKGTNAEFIGALLAGIMLFPLAGTGLATLVAHRWSHLMSIVVGT